MKQHYHIHWKQYRLEDYIFWQRIAAENYMLRYAGVTNPEEAYKVKACRSLECLVNEMSK
jgi:hypothetical protein